MSLTSDIFSVLIDAGAPITLDEIMDALPGGADRGTVNAILGQRKRAGEVTASVKDGKAHYTVAPGFDLAARRRGGGRPKASSGKPDGDPSKKTPSAVISRQNLTDAVKRSNNLLEALESSRDTARAALDMYISSVGDLAIYRSLMDALRAAQMALDAFVGGKP